MTVDGAAGPGGGKKGETRPGRKRPVGVFPFSRRFGEVAVRSFSVLGNYESPPERGEGPVNETGRPRNETRGQRMQQQQIGRGPGASAARRLQWCNWAAGGYWPMLRPLPLRLATRNVPPLGRVGEGVRDLRLGCFFAPSVARRFRLDSDSGVAWTKLGMHQKQTQT
ncbi:hypothetical protein CPLU01_11348 [Colletotrichum plurivorum]|uniref:Uncharacterized protein n=1 Tax=Colletotrichum plurivorum TaxID=2175906 RepID=A0A8H6K2H6_9PEZI|nr:hypothetical protein CPLU01_11348 [Colletotrichum plurivorum]